MSSSYPLKDENIEIRVIAPEDRSDVADFMARYFFADEPLTVGSEPKDELVYGDDLMLSYIDHGTSLMAITKETNEIVGITVTGSKNPGEIEYIYNEVAKAGESKLAKILKFMTKIERDSNLFERYNVEKLIYIIATCVKKEMRGKNIGARLYNAVKDLGQKKGFQLLAADCTGFYSAKIKDRLGWDCVNTVYYKDYLDENNKQIFCPPPPHECCKSYAIRL